MTTKANTKTNVAKLGAWPKAADLANDKAVAALPPCPAGAPFYEVRDTNVAQWRVRVFASGTRTDSVVMRPTGFKTLQRHSVKLGPGAKREDYRKAAVVMIGKLTGGADLRADRHATVAANAVQDATWRDLLTKYLAQKRRKGGGKLSAATGETYSRNVRALLGDYYDLPTFRLRAETLRDLHTDRSDNGSGAGADIGLAALAGMVRFFQLPNVTDLAYGKRTGSTAVVAVRVAKPRIDLDAAPALMAWHARRAESATPSVAPFHYMAILAALTGLRSGTMRLMRWEDVDFKKSEWNIPAPITKGKRAITKPIGPAALALLRKLHAVKKGALVFGSVADPDRPSVNNNSTFTGCLPWAQGLHDSKKVFVAALIEAGAPWPMVQELADHKQSQGDALTWTHYYGQNKHKDAARRAYLAAAEQLILAPVKRADVDAIEALSAKRNATWKVRSNKTKRASRLRRAARSVPLTRPRA